MLLKHEYIAFAGFLIGVTVGLTIVIFLPSLTVRRPIIFFFQNTRKKNDSIK